MYQSPFCPLLPIKWMLCKKALFFSTTCVCILCVCVCFVLFFSHKRPKPKIFFFLLGVGGDIICKRDRWWVYWLLIVYTLLLPWQFSTLIYIYFRNVEIFNFLFPPPHPSSNKKILFGWNDFLNDLFIYLTNFFEACYQGFFFFF
jgi:hypothetical protein